MSGKETDFGAWIETTRCVKCIFGPRQLFRFWHLQHFFGGFPSSPLNRAILSAKIYDTLVGSILAKSYRKFSFSLGISQLGSAYFRRDLSRNELRTEESHLLSPIREAFPVPQYLMAEINRLPTCA